jgi:DDE superfamily endonuclease
MHAPRGERAHGSVPSDPRPALTLTIGLGLEGIVASFLHRGAATAESFRTYVEQCLAPLLSVGTVAVMDNGRAHHTAGIREAIADVGAQLVYLPPYSPDFSPVEHTGSKVQSRMSVAIRSPRPSGSQHASISMPMRCRGGKGPGSTIPGSVVDDLYPILFVPAAEVPDRRSLDLKTVGQLLHDGCRISHGQQDPRSPRHPLLGASVTDKLLEVGRVVAGQLDRSRRSPSHP